MTNIRLLGIIAILGLFYGCAPGHQLALKQLGDDYSGPVLSVQGYVIKHEGQEKILKKQWGAISELMRQQPGFISSYLSPGIGESMLWLVHSEWSSLSDLRNAFTVPEVQQVESQMPEQQFEHLFAHGGKELFSSQK